jgi:hypothetical protein
MVDDLRGQLIRFRSELHDCLTAWPDALFELADAAMCAPGPLHSVPALSLEPEFRRSHGSLYKALANGAIDNDHFDRLLIVHRPADWPNVFAVDATTWDRCDAETSPERGFHYSASKHSAGQPIVAGWCYQWICQLNWAPDSWTAPVDVTRIPPTTDATTGTVSQVRGLVERLNNTAGELPLFVFDAGYDPIAVGYELADVACEVLCRIRDDRVFHADPPPRTSSTMGRPSRHGTRFKCSDPQSWPQPAATLTSDDSRYGTVTVNVWHDLHPKLLRRGHWTSFSEPPIVRGSIIRVEVEHLPKPTTRAKKTLWLWRSGPDRPDLDRCWRAYLRRFDIEHTFRFAKNTLGWTAPSVCTPEQADRWTALIVAVLTQLRLARHLVDNLRLPWERPLEPTRLTPARVRRGFRRLRAHLGTPANPPKPSRAGPGRPKGTRTGPRQRHPPIKRAA